MGDHVPQAGLQNALVTGRYSPFGKVASAEGVVIAIRYTDDKRNRSKTYVEYDVKDLRTGQIYQNCRQAAGANGMNNGDDIILTPAQQLVGSASPVFDPKTAQLSQSDGDRVILSFTYGAHTAPVIVGVLPHRVLTYGAKRIDGLRRLTRHQGTEIEIKNNGDYEVRGVGTTMVDGTTVKLGANATQHVVRGEDLGTNVIEEISAACTTATDALALLLTAYQPEYGPPPLPIPTSLTIATMVSVIGIIATLMGSLIAACGAFDSTLSTKVEVE